MVAMEEIQDELREARAKIDQLEVSKNAQISVLEERVADLSFQLELKPVEEMASQTPYSRKLFESMKSPAQVSVSCDEDMAMSQELVLEEVQAPNKTSFINNLKNMQSYLQQLQHLVSQQQVLHEKQELGTDQKQVDPETAEELEVLKTKNKELETRLSESEESRHAIGVNFNQAVADFNAKEQSFQEELAEKTAVITTLEAKTTTSTTGEEEAAQQVAELTTTIESLKADIAEQQSARSEEMAKDMEELSKTKNELTSATEQLSKMQEELEKAQQATEEVQAAKEALKQNQEELEVTQDKLAKSEQNVAEQRDEIATCTEQVKANELAIAAMQEAHSVMEGVVRAAEAKVAAADELADKLKEAEQNLRNEEATARASREKADQLAVELIEKNKEHADAMVSLRKMEESRNKADDMRAEALEAESKVLEARCRALQKDLDKERNIRLDTAAKIASLKEKKLETNGNGNGRRSRSRESEEGSKRRKIQREIIPSIALSGFRDPVDKKELVSAIDVLGGELVKMTADTFDKNCSHIVIPNHEARTVKTVAAVLTGRWVMTKLWATDSKKAGKWLDEEQYGYCLSHEGIKGKKVFLTKGFISSSGPDRVKQAKQLVEYGSANLCETISKSDIVLRSHNESDSTRTKKIFNNTWEAFIAWIFPTEWRPACTVSAIED
eukprot:TRINITY_DN30267_c0_g1_i1.p1 TRINITY_DN30267_c0_g1~~TRINITY_DN30267_c0_g1_i1.p1  ORF type:complete len:673 (+),score=225.21 TRINITY_DN30267_c0_g1_i1:45-2063(+)